MSPEMKQKRSILSQVSKSLKPLVDVGAFTTINEALIATYTNGKDIEFNRFDQWKKKGFCVNKGEKAFPVWGCPKKFPVDKRAEGEEKNFSFYPICNLFSSEQVSPLVNN